MTDLLAHGVLLHSGIRRGGEWHWSPVCLLDVLPEIEAYMHKGVNECYIWSGNSRQGKEMGFGNWAFSWSAQRDDSGQSEP